MNRIRYSFDGQGVVKADGRMIAQDNPTNETSGQDLRELVRRANAAPDMLAALDVANQRIAELCNMVCTLSGNPRKVRADDYAEEIRAAIAKARGE